MQKDILEKLVQTVLGYLGATHTCSLEERPDEVCVNITGNELNHLIGSRGDALNSLQHFLAAAYYNAAGEYVRILVDVNGYRDQRKERIEDMTKNFIDRVRFFNKDVEMPPMNPSERRIVHTFISSYDDVISESTGVGRDRRVVIKPKKQL